jgi:hypothetical protein
MSSIPKIVWLLWLDFDKKADGILTTDILYFKDRIVHLHDSSWQINAITKWSDLIDLVKGNDIITKLLDNVFVASAHKSDMIRFYLLYTYGGFWLDFSTFLFCPLDIYLTNQPNASFIGMYTPDYMIAQILFGPLSDIQDVVKYQALLDKFLEKQSMYIKLNSEYNRYPFIPENFFMASTVNNGIIHNVYQQQLDFWEKALPHITSKETVCDMFNRLMHQLVKTVFDVNDVEYTILESFNVNDYTTDVVEYTDKLYRKLYKCSYIFNYLQIYLALVSNIRKNNGTYVLTDVTDTPVPEELKKVNICYNSQDGIPQLRQDCKAVSITLSNHEIIYLHPLSLSRIIKWGNTVGDRISFKNTYILDVVNKAKTGHDVELILSRLVQSGIYQVKFSSWTRNSNMLLKQFQEKLPNPLHGGNKSKIVDRNTKDSYTSTGIKVMFTKDAKKVTRVIHKNSRGTKVVKYDDTWILLSKLKISKHVQMETGA